MKEYINKFRRYFPLSLKDWIVYFVCMGSASGLCLALRNIATTDEHVPLIFVLVVLMVSLWTDGYFYGLLTALTSVITVNYAFTYPYAEMNFTIYGYPLTFFTMLTVGFVVSTLTSQLQEQEKIKRESEREKVRANLLRAVSHDLRTPLTAISGSISAVIDGEGSMDSEQRTELLDDARRDAEWLYRMVENLLSVTRIGDGKVDGLKKQEEMLEEVLSEAVVNFRKRNPDVEVSVSVPDEILFVPMDAMLVEQVLRNLMDNAVIHGISTKKICIHTESAGKFATITVVDDGRGLDRKTREHLFDGTLQFSGSRASDTTRGMGIGLMVCKTIIEAHGGTITAENRPDAGAEFRFTLPLEGDKNEH